ncbi:MAG: hypothetical protein RLZZ01_1358, partial [Actinomycetota bacterium]
SPASTAVEISLGGLTVRCREAPVTVAVCGGSFDVRHEDRRRTPWTVVTLRPEDRLVVAAGTWGSWCTLAVAGRLVATSWMGSTSTHVRTGVGGGSIRSGDELVVEAAVAVPHLDGPIDIPRRAEPTPDLRVVLGPQLDCFTAAAVEMFRSEPFAVTAAYDRMGVRFAGPTLEVVDALGIPTTPVVRGSIQVSGDGAATLLQADHQTTGGYPRIATVIGPDAERATQLRAGDTVRFHPIDPHAASDAARSDAALVERLLGELANRPGVRSQRLLGANLVGGVVDAASP